MNSKNKELSSQILQNNNFDNNNIEMGLSKLHRDISSLYLNQKFSDVVFIVQSQRIYAHKAILAVRSKYFEALLFGNLKESKESEITLTYTSPYAFKRLLKFIYCDQITLITADMDTDLALQVLDLANEFLVEDLVMLLVTKLVTLMDVNNVCQIIQRTQLYNLTKLEDKCFSFIDENALEFLKCEEFKNQPEELLLQILKRNYFVADEIEIFKAVAAWCKNNEKKSFGLLECIRFSCMTIEDIYSIVGPTSLVDENVLMEAIDEISGLKPKTSTTRWCPLLNRNVGSSTRNAQVISNNDEIDFCFVLDDNRSDDKFASFPIDDGDGFIVKFGSSTYINNINMLFHIGSDKRYYRYYVEMSRDRKTWKKVVDYTSFDCRGLQTLYFEREFVQYVKVVGTHSSTGHAFEIVSFEAYLKDSIPRMVNNVICPSSNVALTSKYAIVIEGYTDNILCGDSNSNTFTCHSIGENNCIIVQLAQPYVIDTVKLLLHDLNQNSFKFFIESSIDKTEWTMIGDRRADFCRSWQIFNFVARPIIYIKITGTEESHHRLWFMCSYIKCYFND